MEVQQVTGVLLIVVKLFPAELPRARAKVPSVEDPHVESSVPRRFELDLSVPRGAFLVWRLVKEVLVEGVGVPRSAHIVVAELAARVQKEIRRGPGVAVASEREARDLDHLLQEGDDSQRRIVDGDALSRRFSVSTISSIPRPFTHRVCVTGGPCLGDLQVVGAQIAHVRDWVPAGDPAEVSLSTNRTELNDKSTHCRR